LLRVLRYVVRPIQHHSARRERYGASKSARHSSCCREARAMRAVRMRSAYVPSGVGGWQVSGERPAPRMPTRSRGSKREAQAKGERHAHLRKRPSQHEERGEAVGASCHISSLAQPCARKAGVRRCEQERRTGERKACSVCSSAADCRRQCVRRERQAEVAAKWRAGGR